MNHKYDSSEKLETVSDKQWREALDELTAYLRWRLKGKTQRGAHSERELGMPALDYYQEEACNKQTFFVLFFVKLFVPGNV